MRKRSVLEIDILAEYFRRAYRRAGWDRESAAAKAHRLVPLIAGDTPQPEAGRYSLAMQAMRDGIAKRQPKETMNA
jgi:hypothetical protein